jgi:hypothetical protein
VALWSALRSAPAMLMSSNCTQESGTPLARIRVMRAWSAGRSLLLLTAGLGLGCASTVQKAAETAAPRAVNASVKEVHRPATRERVAEVLADPEIRASTASLAQAATDGVLNAMMEEQRIDRAAAAGEAFIERMNRAFAQSLEHDFSPAMARLAAASFETTAEQAKGAEPALKAAIGAVAREAGRQAALGFQDAVIESEARRRRGEAPPGDVLASVGRTSDALRHSASLVTWVVVGAVVLAVASGLTWLGVRLRQERTLNRDLRRRIAV